MSNNITTYAILLSINILLFIIAVGEFVDTPISLILLIMAAVIVANIYKLGPEVRRTQLGLVKNKKFIQKQINQIKENNKTLDEQRKKILGPKATLTDKEREEVLKPTRAELTGSAKDEYWTKLEKDFGESIKTTQEESRLQELKRKRDEITNLITLTKKTYHQRKIDEESFREIVKDYQQQLIEIEGKIKNSEKDSTEEQ